MFGINNVLNVIFEQLRTQSVEHHYCSGILASAGRRRSFDKCFQDLHLRHLRACNEVARYRYAAGN